MSLAEKQERSCILDGGRPHRVLHLHDLAHSVFGTVDGLQGCKRALRVT
jgi:hypothetical protein